MKIHLSKKCFLKDETSKKVKLMEKQQERLLEKNITYEKLYKEFHWDVPEYYNF